MIVGNVGQIAESGFLARAAMLKAGLPIETTAYSVNRQCGSGLQAIVDGSLELLTGNADIVVACGTENMSRLPYYVKGAREGLRMGHQTLEDGLIDILTWPLGPYHNGPQRKRWPGSTGSAVKIRICLRCRAMKNAGCNGQRKFRGQILPVEVSRKKEKFLFDTDEHVRRGLTMEKLAKLRPAFQEGGTVTAANSSGINDGAAAVVLMTRERAEALGCKPKMELLSYAVAGNEPEYMGFAPALATRKLLRKAGLAVEDLDLIELNEAFASQSLAVIRELRLPMEKVNIYGGAIAMGHPVGTSGCLLPVKLMYAMNDTGASLGLVTMCIGGGQGIAALFRNLQ